MKENSIFIDACFGKPTARAPIWIMRQAGRYFPEYRKIREKTTFLNLCKTPELAAKVTLQPIDFLGVDAAIIFSDILIVPEAMGLKLSIEESVGPKLFPKIQNLSDIARLKIPKPEKAYAYLGDAIRLVRRSLPASVPLIGFAGAPWTLLTYMVEGGGSRDFMAAKKLIYQHPKHARDLLKKITESVTDCLNYQIQSGAQAIQLFDTWAGVLSPKDYEEFALTWVRKIFLKLKRKGIPLIYFPKGRGYEIEKTISSGANVIGLDWTVDLSWAKKTAKGRVALQGNLDPMILLSDKTKIRNAAQEILNTMGKSKGFIFNLGHGILPSTPPEHAKYLVDWVKSKGTH